MADPVKCIRAIHDMSDRIQGNDPRGWMKECATETLLAGGDGDAFKACLVEKMKTTRNHIENPEVYAEQLYKKVKSKCS